MDTLACRADWMDSMMRTVTQQGEKIQRLLGRTVDGAQLVRTFQGVSDYEVLKAPGIPVHRRQDRPLY